MPFIFLALGIMLVIVGVRNTQSQLFSLMQSDFSGSSSFLMWVLAIMAVGGIGYIRPLRPISNAFLILILVVLFLSNKGVFAGLQSQLSTATASSSNALSQFNLQGVSQLFNTAAPAPVSSNNSSNTSELNTLQNFFKAYEGSQ